MRGGPCDGVTTVDYAGQTYDTVEIGTQCWLKQNLNVGTMINTCTGGACGANCGTACSVWDTAVNSQGTDCPSASEIEKYCYNDTAANCDSNNNPNYPDGGLYQWNQAMCGSTTQGAQGICPTGWHIPTDAEWHTLERYLWTTGDCASDRVTWGCEPAGTALKPNGTSGFEGNLAGARGNDGTFSGRPTYGYFWSSTQTTVYAWYRYLYSSNTTVWRNYLYKANGLSVRCLKG